MSNQPYKVFESGNTRLRIEYDEVNMHPWLTSDMACNLACWTDDDPGSWLPDACSDSGQVRLNGLYDLIFEESDMEAWIEHQQREGRPFHVCGLRWLDKYGDIVFTSDYLQDVRYDGAIFIDEKRFRQYCSQEELTNEQMIEQMKETCKNEYNVLRAWANGQSFGIVWETKCPTCDQWVVKDSVWGFLFTDSENDMFREMLEHMPDTDEWKEVRQLMFNNEGE